MFAVGADAVNGGLVAAGSGVTSPLVESASDTARALVRLVDTLPEQSRADLTRLVSHTLAAPQSALLREARLGLLIDLLRERRGELVSVEEYQAKRRARNADGARWPHTSALTRAFGTFGRAQVVAGHLAFRGTAARRPRSHHHTGHRPSYTKAEVLTVLVAVRDALGVWPLYNEYAEMVELRRRTARSLGQPEPRLPTRPPIERLFGTYAVAIGEAKLLHGRKHSGHDHGPVV
jgi:hypothetical protein